MKALVWSISIFCSPYNVCSLFVCVVSPRKGSVIDPVLARYCRFFFYACNPYLQAICSQVVSLDQIPRK